MKGHSILQFIFFSWAFQAQFFTLIEWKMSMNLLISMVSSCLVLPRAKPHGRLDNSPRAAQRDCQQVRLYFR